MTRRNGGRRPRAAMATVLFLLAGLTASPAVSADWWTHTRAADALAYARPQTESDVEALARLYEQARYLPDDAEFTATQVEAARQAVNRCRNA